MEVRFFASSLTVISNTERANLTWILLEYPSSLKRISSTGAQMSLICPKMKYHSVSYETRMGTKTRFKKEA